MLILIYSFFHQFIFLIYSSIHLFIYSFFVSYGFKIPCFSTVCAFFTYFLIKITENKLFLIDSQFREMAYFFSFLIFSFSAHSHFLSPMVLKYPVLVLFVHFLHIF
jgi:hypothetical protein